MFVHIMDNCFLSFWEAPLYSYEHICNIYVWLYIIVLVYTIQHDIVLQSRDIGAAFRNKDIKIHKKG